MTILGELSPDLLEKARAVWSDIYSASLQSLTQDYITYPPDDRLPDASNPTTGETQYILSVFKAEGALEIVFEHTIGKRSTPYSWAIKVINPQFYELKDKLYKLYFKPNKVTLDLGGNSADSLQERYDQLLGEVLTGSNLEERYQKELAKIKTQSLTKQTDNHAEFDPRTSKIKLLRKVVPIPKNTDQFELCSVIFKNQLSKEKEWSNDEILEKWGSNFEKSQWRKVYSAAREINQKVATKTTIADLLLVTTKTVQLNPSYF